MSTSLKSLKAQSIGTTPVQLGAYTAPSVTTGVLVFDLTVANILNAPTIVVTVQIKNGATVTNWIVNAVVMQGGLIQLVDDEPKCLAPGDQIFVSSNLANSCDAIASVSEIT